MLPPSVPLIVRFVSFPYNALPTHTSVSR
jgi:hypothetical protein